PLFRAARGRAAGVLAAAGGAPGRDRVRAGPARLRDLDGREARARPGVDRRPLCAALPAHADRDGVPDRRPDVAEHLQGRPLDSKPMCGICGIVSTRGPVDPDQLARMSAKLLHRGPDSDGVFVDGPVGLAARRLSIIDLETGDQPIGNEDGTVHVVQNGELYNYRELRGELERAGHRFRTHGDTEVLVHLYEDHGPDLVGRLRGMFAFALWDARRRRLVLARDRFGIKPLYYRRAGDELAF